MGFCDYGVWLGKYKMGRQVPGRADRNPQAWSGAAAQTEFLPESLGFALKAFQLIKSGPLALSRIVFLIKSTDYGL